MTSIDARQERLRDALTLAGFLLIAAGSESIYGDDEEVGPDDEERGPWFDSVEEGRGER